MYTICEYKQNCSSACQTCRTTIHYCDGIMGSKASQITSLVIVYSTIHSGGDQRKHQSSASLAFVRGIHRWPVDSQHKWPVTRKMFPFDDVIMCSEFSFHKWTHIQEESDIPRQGTLQGHPVGKPETPRFSQSDFIPMFISQSDLGYTSGDRFDMWKSSSCRRFFYSE